MLMFGMPNMSMRPLTHSSCLLSHVLVNNYDWRWHRIDCRHATPKVQGSDTQTFLQYCVYTSCYFMTTGDLHYYSIVSTRRAVSWRRVLFIFTVLCLQVVLYQDDGCSSFLQHCIYTSCYFKTTSALHFCKFLNESVEGSWPIVSFIIITFMKITRRITILMITHPPPNTHHPTVIHHPFVIHHPSFIHQSAITHQLGITHQSPDTHRSPITYPSRITHPSPTLRSHPSPISHPSVADPPVVTHPSPAPRSHPSSISHTSVAHPK